MLLLDAIAYRPGAVLPIEREMINPSMCRAFTGMPVAIEHFGNKDPTQAALHHHMPLSLRPQKLKAVWDELARSESGDSIVGRVVSTAIAPDGSIRVRMELDANRPALRRFHQSLAGAEPELFPIELSLTTQGARPGCNVFCPTMADASNAAADAAAPAASANAAMGAAITAADAAASEDRRQPQPRDAASGQFRPREDTAQAGMPDVHKNDLSTTATSLATYAPDVALLADKIVKGEIKYSPDLYKHVMDRVSVLSKGMAEKAVSDFYKMIGMPADDIPGRVKNLLDYMSSGDGASFVSMVSHMMQDVAASRARNKRGPNEMQTVELQATEPDKKRVRLDPDLDAPESVSPIARSNLNAFISHMRG